jgi:hypothetical protein
MVDGAARECFKAELRGARTRERDLAAFGGVRVGSGSDGDEDLVSEPRRHALPELIAESLAICLSWVPVADGLLELLYLPRLDERRLRWRRWRHGEIEQLTREGALTEGDLADIEAEHLVLHAPGAV